MWSETITSVNPSGTPLTAAAAHDTAQAINEHMTSLVATVYIPTDRNTIRPPALRIATYPTGPVWWIDTLEDLNYWVAAHLTR